MTSAPFYDVDLPYEDNYERGPFGDFKDLTMSQQAASAPHGAPRFNFFGYKLNSPFGIPAGPLLNEHFTTAALRAGFDIATYKTVRSREWGCNPFPNVLSVHPTSLDGTLYPNSPEAVEGLLADSHYGNPSTISISNSFGVPSQDPDVWQPDMEKAIEHAKERPGQFLLASFQGSRAEGMTEEQYIQDHVTTAKLAIEAGAKVLEMNTSCPNEGQGRLLCHNPELVGRISVAVKNEIGDIPLIIKLAFIPNDEVVETMMNYTVKHQSVQGFATINTVPAKLVDKNGKQALPGEGREISGVCGAAIKSAGLEMVERVLRVQKRLDVSSDDFSVIGVGGVVTSHDFEQYRALGATAVMSATGAMWNSGLGLAIRASVK